MSSVNATRKLNRMATMVQQMERYLPKSFYSMGYTILFQRLIPLAGTAGIRIQELSPYQSKVVLKNRRAIQNHLGGLHACSMALAAESATGILVGYHVPDSKLPLLKQMKVNYVRRCQGDITVTASLNQDDCHRFFEQDKGDVTVQVQIQDESGQEPCHAEMIWAWVNKKTK